MKTLLIVYHSMTGGTMQLARAAAAGAAAVAARESGRLQIRCQLAAATGPTEVLAADAYVFATPENLAAMAGIMKDFFDRCYYAALQRIEGRPYAIIVCAGSDGTNAVRQIERIALGWRLKAVAPARIVCTHAQTAEEIARPKTIGTADLDEAEALGTALAEGLLLGIY